MAAHLLSHLASLPLAPTLIWVVLICIMVFSLLPSPLQPFLHSLFSRGKLLQPTSSAPKFTVPQRLFLHFYTTGAVFNGSLLLMVLAYTCVKPSLAPKFQMGTQEAWRVVFLLSLFELQLLRRLYESIYVSKFSHLARMHVLAYLLGLIYYLLAPLSLFPRAIQFVTSMLQGCQSFRHGIYKFEISIQGWNPLLQIGWLYWIGGVIFIWGWVHQYRCHAILASLRSNKALSKEEAHVYKIPYGDWFEYVSSAHYFSEFVMYSSFIIATGGQNLDAWLLFMFVVFNLSIAARDTHKWYLAKFDDYPLSRKAIIPFVY